MYVIVLKDDKSLFLKDLTMEELVNWASATSADVWKDFLHWLEFEMHLYILAAFEWIGDTAAWKAIMSVYSDLPRPIQFGIVIGIAGAVIRGLVYLVSSAIGATLGIALGAILGFIWLSIVFIVSVPFILLKKAIKWGRHKLSPSKLAADTLAEIDDSTASVFAETAKLSSDSHCASSS
ncbi:hypothetical protein MTBPR1_80195 [Candidatus Terasakiella magnetica]|uniref:Transmembrane protein n=1 Tax=Candidatus Terasakiella magnetica TaxID=1867952 RepID=A0A1C3RLL1_9PROT|nr:hypothetical protein MTBPR1_80195 [Candidatus Terasakiella magnetica]